MSVEDAKALIAGLQRTKRYHFVSNLGEGAVGEVDRVFDAHLGRLVARKTLRAELADDEHALRNFINEARILGYLNHAGVIPVFDAYVRKDGRPVYTMREISGRSLAQLLEIEPRSGRALPLALHRTLRIMTRLCEAVAHAHERGVVHLDLKPHNVIVLEHDEVVLVDWGAARIFSPRRYASRLAAAPEFEDFAALPPEDDDVVVGTPRFMSPEQTEAPRSQLRPSSDIFSMGVLFYQMLAGAAPFDGESLEELLFHIRETRPIEPHVVLPGVHRRLSAIVMKMLEKAPEARHASLAEVIAELDAFRSTAAEFPERAFAAGELIFAEGEPGEEAFVIVEGEVEVWTDAGSDRSVLGRHIAGEVVGELALLRDMPRSASATALVPTSVRVIGQRALMAEVERLSPWVLAILSGVVERFVDRSERLVELLNDSSEP